ncbi:type IV toxin-antitoxin system AbiEi family antitoxin [Cellulomonas sp. McL0617]|uniref:type IV toxin-antitoxin system AbiEi family antitoxin n=1 Tax=Cellulomonas sp. McL0617 TaxID=3415675 RepID=UPI003CF55D42
MFTANERAVEVNVLLEDVAEALLDVGVTVMLTRPPVGNAEANTHVTLDAGARGRVTYPTEVKMGHLDPRRATAMALSHERPLLLIARHISDSVAEILTARGVDYADAVGNVRLAWDRMLVDVRGRRPQAAPNGRPRDATAARAFTRSGVMVVFALLSWPDLAARPVREIAAVSDAAVGTVHTVIHELTAAGYLRDGAAGRTLNRAGELLDRWAEAYAINLSRKLPIASFALPDLDRLPELEADLQADGAQIGGELAASRIDPHLYPETSTFYVNAVPTPLVARYRMRRDDDAGSVLLRRRFWHRPDDTSALVPSPLIYADLVSSGDPRQREHAERIRRVDDRLVALDRL